MDKENVMEILKEEVNAATKKALAGIHTSFVKGGAFRMELEKELNDVFDLPFMGLTADEKVEKMQSEIPYRINIALSTVFNNFELVKKIENSYKTVISSVLRAIANQTARGCLIPATAITADAKNDEKYKATIEYSPVHILSIPTEVLIISTDCIKIIESAVASYEDAIKSDVQPEPTPDKETAATGEL